MSDNETDHADDAEPLTEIQEMGRRTGVIAHEFNNLLTSVRGLSSLVLQDLEPDNPIRPDLEEILRAAERAAELTRELLALSREARNTDGS